MTWLAEGTYREELAVQAGKVVKDAIAMEAPLQEVDLAWRVH